MWLGCRAGVARFAVVSRLDHLNSCLHKRAWTAIDPGEIFTVSVVLQLLNGAVAQTEADRELLGQHGRRAEVPRIVAVER